MALQKAGISVAEFEQFIARPENADRRFELINGEIVEKMPTEEHGLIVGRIYGEIYIFLKSNPVGRLAVEVRHQVPGDNQNAPLPDISFTRSERTLPVVKRGAVPQMPDLAVEVKSPDDSLQELRDKAAYYLANGTRMVWLALPHKRLVEVYTQEGPDILTTDDALDGGELLPGFSLPLRDLFAD